MFRWLLIVFLVYGLAGAAAAFERNAPGTAEELLERGLEASNRGDRAVAAAALGFAACKTNPIAQWELGRIYAEDGASGASDCRSLETPGTVTKTVRSLPLVDTNLLCDALRDDADEYVKSATLHYCGDGGVRDPFQAGRWAKLAADKGRVGGQALFGLMLFEGDGVPRQSVLGLMYLTIAGADEIVGHVGLRYAGAGAVGGDRERASDGHGSRRRLA